MLFVWQFEHVSTAASTPRTPWESILDNPNYGIALLRDAATKRAKAEAQRWLNRERGEARAYQRQGGASELNMKRWMLKKEGQAERWALAEAERLFREHLREHDQATTDLQARRILEIQMSKM